MQEPMYDLILARQKEQELTRVLDYNRKTEQYGVTLSVEEAKMLVESRATALKQEGRIEFEGGILPKLIYAFCDSSYISQEDYADTLAGLQDIFYLFKNESDDLLTDDELLTFMVEQFNDCCYGSLEYLGSTCLERFARAIRAGYRGYKNSGGRSEYGKLSEEMRWDRELFLEALDELLE